jgi:hypothetical protein
MNHILHNISILFIIIGTIFITIYFTKSWDQNKITYQKRIHPISIYDYRVSKEYRKMFSQPSIWLGYQDFDPEEPSQKLYLK